MSEKAITEKWLPKLVEVSTMLPGITPCLYQELGSFQKRDRKKNGSPEWRESEPVL